MKVIQQSVFAESRGYSLGSKWLAPFFFAFVASPIFVFLHEVGHYVAGACLGFTVNLHYGQVTGTMPKEALAWRGDAVQASAGPLMQALLAVIGFVWLRRLRVHRSEAALTLSDWLAAILLVLNAGPWLRGFAESARQPQLVDEALVSKAVGLPERFLPYLLASLAVVAVLATMRLHPPEGRVLAVLLVGVAGASGFFLWMRLVGPVLLP